MCPVKNNAPIVLYKNLGRLRPVGNRDFGYWHYRITYRVFAFVAHADTLILTTSVKGQ